MIFDKGQMMTLRTALGSFLMDLEENGLGEDAHGRAMTAGYKVRIGEILKILETIEGLGGSR